MDTPASMISPTSSTATAAGSSTTVHSSTEVPGKATRRRFTLGYKRKIVALAAWTLELIVSAMPLDRPSRTLLTMPCR